jgi:DNA-binding GntR family transcriptional regulator
MSDRSAPKTTRTQEVYEALRADLLNARVAPGEKLQAAALGKRFAVSLSVVREALTRLAEQGLLVQTAQRGFRAATLSEDDLADLTRLRVQIETLAVRESILLGDVEWETRVVSTHYALERTPLEVNDSLNEDWAIRHRDFHEALLSGCGSPRLMALTSALRESAEMYRRWYWNLLPHPHRDLEAEHRELKDLVLAGEADRAATALADHISCGPSALLQHAKGTSELTGDLPPLSRVASR